MKAAATLPKAVVLLFSNAREEIVHYSLFEPKHIRAFMPLGYLVHGAVNFLGGTCQLLLIFMQENSAYPELLSRNALLLCCLWCWKREEASVHLQSGFWGC